ncbi:Transposase IS30-like HTH domain containing protein [uncultured Caudovirales phage]|uniref:Transposase IS30-like HTH domain containing protein n=1 Tax=uncultured Caudovirales phage TaxID=2100421 RepID=A0A6J5MAA9_9CAUD|nr:Transposase IS30-like HTH domain containing protein [uncultured Caudovirales phage]
MRAAGYTPEQIQAILTLYKSGYSLYAIAKQLNMNVGSVSYYINKYKEEGQTYFNVDFYYQRVTATL